MSATRVMVVEDERIVALNIKRRLIELGYEVPAFVASGAQALAKIDQAPPDVVLMDIHIDGAMDGIETASQIPPELGIPVIYLTAYAGDETLQRARATKPSGYLLKPFSERELHATIQMAIAGNGPRTVKPMTLAPSPSPQSAVAVAAQSSAGTAVRWGSGTRSDRAQAQARLLDTALACYQQQGIAATSMADIAQAAKVTRPTVYRYFSGHQDILDAVVRRELMNFFVDNLRAELRDPGDFGDVLVELLLRTLSRAQQRSDFVFESATLPVLTAILLGDRDYQHALAAVLRPLYEAAGGSDELPMLCEWFNRMLASYLSRASILFPAQAQLRELLQRWLPRAQLPLGSLSARAQSVQLPV